MTSVSNGQTAQNGTSTLKCVIAANDPFTAALFLRQVIQQQRGVVIREISALGEQLTAGLGGDMPGRPDLAVRVRVGAAHHGAFVLKYLDVMDALMLAELDRLPRPGIRPPAPRPPGPSRAGSGHAGARKHTTRQRPRSASSLNKGCVDSEPSGVSGSRAEKSLVKAKVPV